MAPLRCSPTQERKSAAAGYKEACNKAKGTPVIARPGMGPVPAPRPRSRAGSPWTPHSMPRRRRLGNETAPMGAEGASRAFGPAVHQPAAATAAMPSKPVEQPTGPPPPPPAAGKAASPVRSGNILGGPPGIPPLCMAAGKSSQRPPWRCPRRAAAPPRSTPPQLRAAGGLGHRKCTFRRAPVRAPSRPPPLAASRAHCRPST